MARPGPLPPPPFDAFFTYDATRDYCRRLAAARPDLCSISSLGFSRQGRDILLLTITDSATGPAEAKPAYLIHANIHADELSGINVALESARRLLADHSPRKNSGGGGGGGGGGDLLRRVAFYIVPMLNPDNGDLAARLSMPLRSRFEDDADAREPNTIYQQDIDGDGAILRMRQEHPDGDHMRDPDEPRLVIPRRPNAKGPFYRVWPEGLIHDFDGDVRRIRAHSRSYDWNRQWAYDWRPEPEQPGAGDYPFSEPEMQHLARFLAARTNLIGMVGYHTGPAAILRPPSAGSVRDMVAADHQLIDELGRLGVKATGFPLYPAVDCHPSFRGPNNFRGHSLSFAYYHLGIVGFEIELGDLFDTAGFDREVMHACRNEDERIAVLRKVLKWWDRQPRSGPRKREPLWVDWKPFDHPQLGRVEIGGFLVRHLYNQSLRRLRQIAPGLHTFNVQVADAAPRLVVEDCRVDDVGGGVCRVRVSIANRGWLSTSVTIKGRSLRRMQPVHASVQLAPGVTLLSRRRHFDLGHLDGPAGVADIEWFVQTKEATPVGGELCRLDVHAGAGGSLTLSIPSAQQ